MTLVSDEIFYPDQPHPTLMGGRCKQTGRYKFPYPLGADRERHERVPLKREGTLWSYTIQRFPPSRPYIGVTDPAKFKPFALGYVELDGQVIVETLISTSDLDSLKIGMDMVVKMAEFERGDGDGTYTTYAFTPKEEA